VPHILAASETDAAFAFGYAQAEDHTVEIAWSYVAARGEEARYFGTGTDNDFLIGFFDVRRESERDLTRVSRAYRKWVEACIRGFNHFVAGHRAELPQWIPVFTAADVMAHRRAAAVRQVYSQEFIRQLECVCPRRGPDNLWGADPAR
jgi:acyl-homoserine-lactone acylase